MTTPSDNDLSVPNPYHAYLVRLWQDTPDSPWRASAQSVQTGEVMRFGTLQALFDFLEGEAHNSMDSDA